MFALVISLIFNISLLWKQDHSLSLQYHHNKIKKRAKSPVAKSQQNKYRQVILKLQKKLRLCERQQWTMLPYLIDSLLAGRMLKQKKNHQFNQGLSSSSKKKTSLKTKTLQKQKSEDLKTKAQAQREALCRIARLHLKEHWKKQQKNILNLLRKKSSHRKIQIEFKKEMQKMAKALGLSRGAMDSYESAYKELYLDHVQTFFSHTKGNPPNWNGMFKTARKLFHSQDIFIKKQFGEKALQRYRYAQLNGRTAIMAFLSQYAKNNDDKNKIW